MIAYLEFEGMYMVVKGHAYDIWGLSMWYCGVCIWYIIVCRQKGRKLLNFN